MSTINDIRAAYQESRGLWSGCSWPTHFGCLGLNLDGVSSRQAHQAAARWQAMAGDRLAGDEVTADDEISLVDMALHLRLGRGAVCLLPGPDGGPRVCGRPAARFCAQALVREWQCAASWLQEIEADARWARKEAQRAVRAAEDGDWVHALEHARQACLIESGYDDPRPWIRLQWVIELASRLPGDQKEPQSACTHCAGPPLLPGANKTQRQRPGGQPMMDLRQIEHAILAKGRVDGHSLEVLRQQLYAGGTVERQGADFLAVLRKRVQHRTPAFEHFFYQAIKDHLLAHGRIDAEGASWLRQILFADGTIRDEERKLLHELKGEAKQVCPEFEVLFKKCMKQPPEQRTCG